MFMAGLLQRKQHNKKPLEAQRRPISVGMKIQPQSLWKICGHFGPCLFSRPPHLARVALQGRTMSFGSCDKLWQVVTCCDMLWTVSCNFLQHITCSSCSAWTNVSGRPPWKQRTVRKLTRPGEDVRGKCRQISELLWRGHNTPWRAQELAGGSWMFSAVNFCAQKWMIWMEL